MINRLETNARYCARIDVGFLKRAFANEGVIADQIKSALPELADVTVRKDESAAGRYWAWGTWTAEERDVPSDLPDEIKDVTRV